MCSTAGTASWSRRQTFQGASGPHCWSSSLRRSSQSATSSTPRSALSARRARSPLRSRLADHAPPRQRRVLEVVLLAREPPVIAFGRHLSMLKTARAPTDRGTPAVADVVDRQLARRRGRARASGGRRAHAESSRQPSATVSLPGASRRPTCAIGGEATTSTLSGLEGQLAAVKASGGSRSRGGPGHPCHAPRLIGVDLQEQAQLRRLVAWIALDEVRVSEHPVQGGLALPFDDVAVRDGSFPPDAPLPRARPGRADRPPLCRAPFSSTPTLWRWRCGQRSRRACGRPRA